MIVSKGDSNQREKRNPETAWLQQSSNRQTTGANHSLHR